MELDDLLLMEGATSSNEPGHTDQSTALLYMPEELKKSIDPSAYRMNYSLSSSSDTPVVNVVTSSDLIEDGGS